MFIKLNRLCLAAIFVLSAFFALTSTARAQATRTWVSGVGDDANPGSRTAPCKTIAGALAKTAAGGEIDALDPGGFGAVTILRALTLDGKGPLASVLVSGTTALTISAGPNDVVTIRNFSINGLATGIH
ncbi:MAG TPA: right-handed parallel beta-helix repeat-containing protein, partial [Verrucomicrobiae bacterium]